MEHNDTRRNLLYVGHSMGTTMAFVMLASKPEYNDKIQALFAMAPVGFMGHVKSPIRLLAPFSHDIEVSLLYDIIPKRKTLISHLIHVARTIIHRDR